MKFIPGLLFCFIPWLSPAQKVVDNFTLTNVSDGASVSLDGYRSLPVIVVIFTSNACPYDGYYQARIRSLIMDYRERIQVLLINSHVESAESEDQMKSAYGKWNLSVPYLSDKNQAVMQLLGAKKSPEAFLLKSKDGKFEVVYSGAIDDNAQMANAVNRPYLKDAIDRMLSGQVVEPATTRTVGCTIRRR
jgi:peroxiredoxin